MPIGVFVNGKTIKKILDSSTKTNCYSTLEDLNCKLHELDTLLELADQICLVDLNEQFVDVISDTSLYLYLNFFKRLKKFKDTEKIQNFGWHTKINKNLFAQLHQHRQSDDKTLWISGCSITYGVGVSWDQRYAALLEEKLKLPTILLAQPSSSIAWQADQLLQSDIRQGDLVVWGLTSFNRINYADGTNWKTGTISNYLELPKSKQYWSIDYFNSATQSIPCIKNILQVMNFCQKIGAKLYLINLLEPTWVDFILSQEETYLDLTEPFDLEGRQMFLDLGTDNHHPGPKHHKKYADAIFNFIKENNHGQTI
jgi:hypothetical protein